MSFKLISADVLAFGKLKNFHFDFCDGLNLLCEKNGFGKSTFASFVKAMFYGIGASKKSDLEQNDLKHYQPYNSTEKFGGSLRFVYSDRAFRVERFFGNTPKEHTFKLYDDSTNKLLQNGVDDKQGELGLRLFGLNAEAFERCLYLPQKEVVVASNDSFVQKLSNLAENTTEQNNCQKACDALTKFYKLYKLDKGDGGILSDLKRQKETKLRQLEESRLTQQRIEKLNQSIIDCALGLEKTDARRQELEQKEQNIQNQLAKMANLSAVKQIEVQIADKETEKTALTRQIQQLELPQNPLVAPILPQTLSGDGETSFKAKSNKTFLTLKIILLALLAVSVGAFFISPFVGVILFAVVAISLAVVFVLDKKATKKSKAEADEQLKRQKELQEEQLDEYQRQKAEYESYLAKKAQVDELKLRLTAVQMSQNDLKQQIKAIAPNGAQELILAESEYLFEQKELKKQQEENDRQYDFFKSKLAEDKKELVMREERFCLPSQIEGEIEQLTAEITQAQTKYSCAKKAVELLKKAKENLTQGYLPKLNDLLNKNLCQLSNFDFEQATVDANFEVKVLEGGQMREVGYLSVGCREICSFALRLSLMQCIYDKDLPFVVLDDPFVNFDKQNFKSAIDLLKKLSQNTQVVYLTCWDRFLNE